MNIGEEYDTPDWSPDKAQKEMEQAITALGKDKIIGVYAANDGTAGGAIAAMKAGGFTTLPPVTGQDAELAAIQRILTGEQYMTRLQGDQAGGRRRPRRWPSPPRPGKTLLGRRRRPMSTTAPPTSRRCCSTRSPSRRTTSRTRSIEDGFYTAAQICTGAVRRGVHRGGHLLTASAAPPRGGAAHARRHPAPRLASYPGVDIAIEWSRIEGDDGTERIGATATDTAAGRSEVTGTPVLSLRGITKRFGAVQALSDAALDVNAGEVLALVGDNGAGKSTMIKVIAGVGPRRRRRGPLGGPAGHHRQARATPQTSASRPSTRTSRSATTSTWSATSSSATR